MRQHWSRQRHAPVALAIIGMCALLGVAFIFKSHADTLSAVAEAEQGAIAGNAAASNAPNASGGQSVLFGGSGGGGLGDTGPLGARMQFGAFTPFDGTGLSTAIANLESLISHKVSPVQYFTDTSTAFDVSECQKLASSGHALLLAVEPDAATADIISGKKDSFFKQYGTDTAKCNTPIYIRLYPEMNGSFASYSPFHDRDYPGDSASTHTTSVAQLINAYKHIIDTVRTTNPNIKWVFAPNQTDDPVEADNKLELFYPGDAYTDVLAFDAYNWGNGGPFGEWQSAHDVYADTYNRLVKLNGTSPVWVTETSSKEPQEDDGYGTNVGKSKGQWITDLFNETGFPRMKAIIWFNEDKHTNNPGSDSERDWRVNSSADSLTALKQALKSTP